MKAEIFTQTSATNIPSLPQPLPKQGPRPWHIRAASKTAFAVATTLVLVGCVRSSHNPTGQGGMDAAEMAAKLERALSRENAPQPTRTLSLMEGLASGSIESAQVPQPECKRDKDGDLSCLFESNLGKDQDGDDSVILCSTSTYHSPFGRQVNNALGESRLSEVPLMETKAIGEGLSTLFMANHESVEEQRIRFGTAKIATLYAREYMVSCFDMAPGGRETFRRVVGGFFASLQFKQNPDKKIIAAFGYRTRAGNRDAGFRYSVVHEKKDQKGFVEGSMRFRLDTDGKTWTIFDREGWVERDGEGQVEKLTGYHWLNGKGPVVLSAKPWEDGRFRLRFQAGTVSNGLESTPRAPLNTELWASPELAELSSGKRDRYTYAALGLDDSDPVFQYVTLTRSDTGVLFEEQSNKPPDDESEGKASVKDELHVDAQGLVTKQVTSDSVTELIYKWGDIPRKPEKKSATESKRRQGGKGR